MTILICKANEPIIKDVLPKVKFQECTKHTSEFKIGNKAFQYLYQEVKLLGYNPFALMTWY